MSKFDNNNENQIRNNYLFWLFVYLGIGFAISLIRGDLGHVQLAPEIEFKTQSAVTIPMAHAQTLVPIPKHTYAYLLGAKDGLACLFFS